MIIENFQHFKGQHCETTATGTLLLQCGIDLSEPMLFGLGEGLGFIYWKMKSMDFPFLGGRVKTDLLTQNITKNLHLELNVKETSSIQKAWDEVRVHIDCGQIVGLKLDSYFLDYFTNKFHFAGHYVAIYGYDQHDAYLVDTIQQGGLVKTSLKNLALARSAKGSMSSRNLYYTIKKGQNSADLKSTIPIAIKNNATTFLSSPISNVGYKGILKTSQEIIKWFKSSKDIENEFKNAARLMEKAGTGGALFRNLYRDFLMESYDLLTLDSIKKAHFEYIEVAKLWSAVSQLFLQVSETKDISYVMQASEILKKISKKEKRAMELMANI